MLTVRRRGFTFTATAALCPRLDPALLALNPTGLRNATGSPLTNASQRILLFNGPAGPPLPLLQAAECAFQKKRGIPKHSKSLGYFFCGVFGTFGPPNTSAPAFQAEFFFY